MEQPNEPPKDHEGVSGSSRKRRNSAVAVKETAASSRPKRARVVRGIVDPIDRPILRRQSSGASTKAAPTTVPRKKGTPGRPPKNKAVSSDSGSNSATKAQVKTGHAHKRGRPAKKKNQADDTGYEAGPSSAAGPTAEEESSSDTEEERSYWLMKAEPESRFEKGVDVKFSIDDLREAKEPEAWDGVRNAAARNNMRAMRKGDLAFFYHSNCKVPGIAGVMEIVQEHSIDESAFDPAHPYYDAKSTRNNPKWEVVHVEFRKKFADLIRLTDLKSYGKTGGALDKLQMLTQSRLSVSAVTGKQWRFIMSLAKEEDEKKDGGDA